MTTVLDTGPLHYLILTGCDHVLPQMFSRVLVPRVIIEKELRQKQTPEAVRRWVEKPPRWLEVLDPQAVEPIATLGMVGVHGDGDRAAIALAIEHCVDVLVMDDRKARREAESRGLQTVGFLHILDEAAERGWLPDLIQKLDVLEYETSFYIGPNARVVIDGLRRRAAERSNHPDGS
jgi:predicted nucleic acid-binding protein